MEIGCIWRVAWGNPYKNPPDGMKDILCESFQPPGSVYWSKHPPEIDAAYPGFGKGYCITWSAISKPPKALSPDALASVRRKRLERRVRKKYPLFAEMMIQEEMEKKPDYYNGVTDKEIEQARDRAIQTETKKYKGWIGKERDK